MCCTVIHCRDRLEDWTLLHHAGRHTDEWLLKVKPDPLVHTNSGSSSSFLLNENVHKCFPRLGRPSSLSRFHSLSCLIFWKGISSCFLKKKNKKKNQTYKRRPSVNRKLMVFWPISKSADWLQMDNRAHQGPWGTCLRLFVHSQEVSPDILGLWPQRDLDTQQRISKSNILKRFLTTTLI